MCSESVNIWLWCLLVQLNSRQVKDDSMMIDVETSGGSGHEAQALVPNLSVISALATGLSDHLILEG